MSPNEGTITLRDCDSNVAVSVCDFALRIGSVHAITDTQMHLDSHVDTCVVERNALVVQKFEQLVDVCGYDPAGPIMSSLCTVSAALAYYTRPTVVIHQTLFIPPLHHNLLCLNQMRLNDVVVHEQPKFLTERLTDTRTHAL
jgi:hypothetical protein